jgi:hypothetical protein
MFGSYTFQVSKPRAPTKQNSVVRLANVPANMERDMLELILERHFGGSFSVPPEIKLNGEQGEAIVVFQDIEGRGFILDQFKAN